MDSKADHSSDLELVRNVLSRDPHAIDALVQALRVHPAHPGDLNRGGEAPSVRRT